MNVCLMLHGQPRFLDNPFTYATHKREILDKYNTDVYCHTWFCEGGEVEASTWSGISSLIIDPESIKKINEKYQPVLLKCEPPRQFNLDDELLVKLLTTFSKYQHWNTKNISNSLSSLYSIEQVVDLAMSRELSKYDFFILSRYDNLIYRLPDLNKLCTDKFYISDHHDMFPDLFFVFGKNFLEAFKIFSKHELLIKNNFSLIDGASSLNEGLKAISFSENHKSTDLIKIPLPVRVVRNNFDRGDVDQLFRYQLSADEMLINWFSLKDIRVYLINKSDAIICRVKIILKIIGEKIA